MQEVVIVFAIGLGMFLFAMLIGLPLLYLFDTYVWPQIEWADKALAARWTARRHGGPR